MAIPFQIAPPDASEPPKPKRQSNRKNIAEQERRLIALERLEGRLRFHAEAMATCISDEMSHKPHGDKCGCTECALWDALAAYRKEFPKA